MENTLVRIQEDSEKIIMDEFCLLTKKFIKKIDHLKDKDSVYFIGSFDLNLAGLKKTIALARIYKGELKVLIVRLL